MSDTAFIRLIESYCDEAGIDHPEIGPEGAIFEMEDAAILVTHDSDFDRVSILAPVADVAPERLPLFSVGLLQLNAALALSGGQAFSVDMESGAVSLQQSLPLDGLEPKHLDRDILATAEKARAARGLVSRLGEFADALPAPVPEAPAAVEHEEPPLVFRP
jgi:hypothetical protein